MKKLLMVSLLLCLVIGLAAAEGTGTRYEWEDGVLSGKARALATGGTGWVEGLSGEGDGVALTITSPADGFYDLTVCQAGIGGYKENNLLVDGTGVGTIIAEGLSYTEQTLPHIWLDAGEHEISIGISWGNVRLDWLEVTPSGTLPDDLYDVEPVLCNPDPSPEAQALMDWMCEIYGEKMISGQYLDEWQYGQELKAVASVTDGRYPALVGLDLMNYSPANLSFGGHGISVDQVLNYWKKGHIITMCWHWTAPEKYLDGTGNNWWGGFYTENTTIDLGKIMNGEDPEGYDLLLRDIDAIAAQLTRLRDAGVPVLWRPLHEASGGWFWWGASGPEPYLKLYRLLYDKLTNEHGLNNLIWIWNGQDAAWYPGDDVVDMIGTDIYAGNHAHDSQSAAFLECAAIPGTRKIVLLSECGCVHSPIKCQRDGIMWSSWAVWCYEFVQVNGKYNGEFTSPETLKLFYEPDYVVTLADVPAFGRASAEAPEAAPASEDLTWAFSEASVTGAAQITGNGVDIRGNAETDTVTLTVTVPADGDYLLTIVQNGIGGYKENYLAIDGETLGNTVVQGEAEEACDFGTVHLTAGEHEVKITAFWGWVTLKSLTLTPTAE